MVSPPLLSISHRRSSSVQFSVSYLRSARLRLTICCQAIARSTRLVLSIHHCVPDPGAAISATTRLIRRRKWASLVSAILLVLNLPHWLCSASSKVNTFTVGFDQLYISSWLCYAVADCSPGGDESINMRQTHCTSLLRRPLKEARIFAASLGCCCFCGGDW